MRDWTKTADVEGTSVLYRTTAGTQTLRPLQAAALSEASECGGLFVYGRVGIGKTLISALLSVAMGAKRALVVVPGKGRLVQKTIKEFQELRLHWKIPRNIRIVSYEFLGRATNDGWLERNPCDVMICDEGHKLRDLDNCAAARKVQRYLMASPSVRFCVMSGTPSSHGDLKDYAHLLIWALRGRSPVPQDKVKQYCRALDGTGDSRKLDGAKTKEDARDRFKAIMQGTKGCIMSNDSYTGVPLTVEITKHESPEELREPFERLRNLWEAPDGWSFGDDQFQVAAMARQLANGFYYRHEPRPPQWLLTKRKAWTSYCRDLIEQGAADSEGQIKLAIRNGERPEGAGLLEQWEIAEASFPMTRVADWFSLAALEYACEWLKKTKRGIVWVGHIEVGEALETMSGCTFFRGQNDRDILNEDGSRNVIASIQANGTGKNLQPFCNGLTLAPPANGADNEQKIGRMHREGQKEPVHEEFYCACLEHFNAVHKSIVAARTLESTLGPQKMSMFDAGRPLDQDHPAWQKASKVD